MKKLLSFIIIFICIINISTLTIFAQSADNFSVVWSEKGASLQCTATYSKDGSLYEMVINGIKNKLSESQLKNVADNLSEGKAITITDPGIIDAEKFSCINPMTDGITPADRFIDMSGIRADYKWGDSFQCWAASVSNMLTTTGWTKKAINPDSGKTFSGEDEVFSFFTKYCINKGCYAADGINFFFDGTISPEMEMSDIVRHPFSGAFPEKDISKYLSSVKVCDDDESDNDALYKKSLELISQIEDGGSVGLSIVINGCKYTLENHPEIELEKYRDKYRSSEYIYVDTTTPMGEPLYLPGLSGWSLEKHFYAIDEDDNVVILEKTDDKYKELSGKTVDTALVKEDVLLKKDDGTYIYPFMIDEDVYTFIDHDYYNKHEVEIEPYPISFGITGGHAVTANGYVKNIDTGDIEALFIVNSDNDSDMMPYKEENLSKENRPNRMVVYPAKTVKGIHNKTLALFDYDDSIATIVKAALLLPESDMPQYTLGDADKNGFVDIVDATIIQKFLAELVNTTDIDKTAADANCNGIVDIADATCIQEYLAELSNIDGTIPYNPDYPINP